MSAKNISSLKKLIVVSVFLFFFLRNEVKLRKRGIVENNERLSTRQYS